ncbi:beta-lactamase-like protein [Phaeosphaeriaceae sp. PMI808]|nr:beta-lactamase-like protein [Phaeosphaeriaceae sp. PMI808]
MNFQSGDLAICETCGTQYDAPLSSHPKSCRICDDPRQYVPATGQTWSSLNKEQGQQKNVFETDQHDSRIHCITTEPLTPAELPASLASSTTTRKQLGIGERAFLLQTSHGNVLWDLVAFIDSGTVEFINSKGGLKAIVISHPHFYTTHLEWAKIFNCPVYMSSDDAEWLNREDKEGVRKGVKSIQHIEEVGGEVKAIQCGGHFDGSLVLLWEKKLFIADTMMSAPSGFYHKDRLPGTVSYSFQWSYPNLCLKSEVIPLPPSKIHGIWKAIKPFDFDSTYGAFQGQNVTRPDLKEQVLESMKIFCKVGGHDNAAVYDETL